MTGLTGMTRMEAERIVIGALAEGELPALLALVTQAGLSGDGLAGLSGTRLVARAGERLVGTVSLEVFGNAGLLRSLAVAADSRAQRLGTRLCRALFLHAAERGIERLVLLTLDAAPFFRGLGFVEGERTSAPEDLAASPQFATGTCAQATCMTLDLARSGALQDRYPGNHCFGCGPANEQGLQLKSYPSGEAFVARFRPSAEHNAGPEAWLNGGIVATLLDCHSIFAALADAYEREGRPFASAPLVWYVTGSLSVRCQRPAPIEAEVLLVARVRSSAARKTSVECTLSSGGEVCATAEVVAVRVAEGWKTRRAGASGP